MRRRRSWSLPELAREGRHGRRRPSGRAASGHFAFVTLLGALGCAVAASGRPPPPTAAPPAPPHELRLRALVDDDYRAQEPAWQARVVELVRRADRLVEPALAVRLSLVEARPWARRGGADLGAILGELQADDPGYGVDWVVGWVSAPPSPPGPAEPLGVAARAGHHLVLRAAPAGGESPAAQEGRLRREAMLLVHEWAHTLGAEHEPSRRSLMSEVYDPVQAELTEATREKLRRALRARLEPAGPWAGSGAGEPSR